MIFDVLPERPIIPYCALITYQQQRRISQNLSVNRKHSNASQQPLKSAVSNMSIWLIAILALVSIVLLFYVLEQCSKFLARNHSGNPKRKRSRLPPVSKMATIIEQHVRKQNKP